VFAEEQRRNVAAKDVLNPRRAFTACSQPSWGGAMTYTVIKSIGRVSFGVVELVTDDEGKQWARKTFVPPNLPDVTNDETRQRFEREVRYQSEIEDPNVVNIRDYDLEADPPWFVMELAECSLADELSTDRTLGGDPRQPLFDVLAGLEAIHQKGYKHRDLKPANILKFIDTDGGVRYAISDFGLMFPPIPCNSRAAKKKSYSANH
jgi:eukaryotic-like serine/threonine-protein kinase